MRVGLNLLYLVERSGGVGRYMRELTAGLVRSGVEVVGFASRDLPADVRRADWAAAVEWVELPIRVTAGPPGWILATTGAQWLGLPALARRHRLDLIHGPAYIAPPVSPGVRSIVTIPDLVYTRYPTLLDARTRLGMRLTVRPSARGADRVIAISRTVADDVVATLGIKPGKVDVTALGGEVASRAVPAPREELGLALPDGTPLVLCVAQKRVHKNLQRLLEAVAQIQEPLVLALVGFPTPHEEELRATADRLGVAHRVRFVGWVSEEHLEGLYAAATCCCLPSLEEGFGLPVLEAMAREVPVACSGTGALGEVAGSAAELFDPLDPAAIAAALRRLLQDARRRAELVDRGRTRAAEFTWDRCARETLAVYERALAGP
ncbi:glycosyltransferase family 4 protein [Paraconexibacter algicola]|uniref:Glycosyltransferase family 1 protein n=1 Tax=Paraconexibacter algicola TaxID=2133960 RepID=A0A2T4UKW2_9ACTN|nr:glycosyltransferase family 1 protein [Paraconexibacter algicola]PTL59886.1 glycosyltransferase family 1 protein [Paraconexibacter algicola]